MIEVGLLGPLAVSVDGRPLAVTTGRLRTVLAALAISAGRAVSVDRLITTVWAPEQLPERPEAAVRLYISRLRSLLGAGTITGTPSGYALNLSRDQVDVLRFGRLLEAAAAATDRATEYELLTEGLALWRGIPFEDAGSPWLDRSQTPPLVERYLTAVERRSDVDIAAGRTEGLVAQLRALADQHPLRESLWARLLVALDRSGRLAEALEQYEVIRVRLSEELGTDPGPELQALHRDLLAGGTRPAAVPAAPGGRMVPRQLPADIDGFVGREAALKQLSDLVRDGDDRTGGAVLISAIGGTAGIGKTALAVHFAHQIADRFPDGQLYVNLRGYHPSGQVISPTDAVRGFLESLGVAPQRIPPELDAQVGLYRSLLAGQRILVVLDNARDADQVRPLLPGSPTCLVVVTSRSQLTGLIVAEAARPLPLDLLSVEEARDLLAGRLGPERIAAEPPATDEIIGRCARLPLALAIVAARAAAHPSFRLSALAGELRDTRSGLDLLSGGDPASDVRAVFSWSYRSLSTDAARLFRLLGLHPGPDLTAAAAASLAGIPARQVAVLLAELCWLHLLHEHVPGRYSFHDLLRAYATELADAHDSDDVRRAALGRVLDHYLHTAHAAAMHVNPHRTPIVLAPPRPGVTTAELAGRAEALAWFGAEHAVLRNVIASAAGAGFDAHTWRLAWTLVDFHFRRWRLADWAAVQQLALEAAGRLDEPQARAHAQRGLGHAYTLLGRHEEAHTQLAGALALYRQIGDPVGAARTHNHLSVLFGAIGRHSEALHHDQQALELARSSGDQEGEATALNAVGWQHLQLGDHQRSVHYCRSALALFQEIGDRAGEAAAWDSLGHAYHRLGDHTQAVSCYRSGLDLLGELGSRHHAAETLTNLGDAYTAAGDRAAARAAWREALAIFTELGHPDATRVHAKLDALHHLVD
jgi:DNA-binding SARP family transcriptional activator/tetratricopeptide (TPR) repeat protein